MKKFDARMFYQIGIFCFIAMAIGNSLSFYMAYDVLDVGMKISRVFGIFFNILLIGFFYHLLTQMPKADAQTEQEMVEMLKNLK